jgi:hypothetical protein
MEQALNVALSVMEAERQEKTSEIFYARSDKPLSRTKRNSGWQEHENEAVSKTADSHPNTKQTNRAQNRSARSDFRCFECQGYGHLARECPTRLKKGTGSQTEPGKRNPSGRSRRPSPAKEVPSFIVGTRKQVGGERAGSSLHFNTPKNTVGLHVVSLMLERGMPSVPIEVEGKTRRLILDTGSNISILQEGVSQHEVTDSPLKPFGVTGEVLATKGQQSVSFMLGGQKYDHKFLVSHLPTDAAGILGMDFLERTNAEINFGKGLLTLPVKDEPPHSYGTLPTRCAVLTVFLENKTPTRTRECRFG